MSWITTILGRKSLTSGKLRSFLHLLGIFSTYLIESYEKYPEISEQIFGRLFGVSKELAKLITLLEN